MDELRRIRKERGLSQMKLAKRTGVDQSTIAQIETGARRPSLATLEKLAVGLDCEVADFFRGYEVPLAQAPLPFSEEDSEQRRLAYLEAWEDYLSSLLAWTEELRTKFHFDTLDIHSDEEKVVQVRLVFREAADFRRAVRRLSNVDRNFFSPLSENPRLPLAEAEQLQEICQTIAELRRRGDLLDQHAEKIRERVSDLKWLKEQAPLLEWTAA